MSPNPCRVPEVWAKDHEHPPSQSPWLNGSWPSPCKARTSLKNANCEAEARVRKTDRSDLKPLTITNVFLRAFPLLSSFSQVPILLTWTDSAEPATGGEQASSGMVRGLSSV